MVNPRPSLEKNIQKLYWLDFFRGSIFFIPIIVPFMQEYGLSFSQIFLLESIFALTIVLLEIPSGYASDAWGRKNTLILGSVISFLGILFYAIGNAFQDFFIGNMLLGIGLSFYSGTLEAITYDSLLELGKEHTYKKVAGKLAFLHFGAEAIPSLFIGFVAAISLRLPMILTLIPFGLACITTMTLTEPKRKKIQETRHVHAIWNITKQTMLHNAPLRSIILLHSLLATMTLSLFWFSQPYQLSIGLPIAWFGVVHGVIVAAGAIASKYTHQIEKHADDRLLLIGVALAVIGAYIGLGFIHSWYGLALLLICRMAWGVLSPATSDVMNRMTDSTVRATILSIRGFFFRGTFSVIAPILGYMADVLTINQAILLTGIIGGVLVSITLVAMRFVWNDIPK